MLRDSGLRLKFYLHRDGTLKVNKPKQTWREVQQHIRLAFHMLTGLPVWTHFNDKLKKFSKNGKK